MDPPSLNRNTICQSLNATSQATNVFEDTSNSDENSSNDDAIQSATAAPELTTKANRSCYCCPCCTMPTLLSRFKEALFLSLSISRKPDDGGERIVNQATTTDIQVPERPIHRRHRAIEIPNRSGHALVLDGFADSTNGEDGSKDGNAGLSMSNDVRTRLRKESMGKQDWNIIEEVIRGVLESTQNAEPELSLETIIEAHFDKMLEELLDKVRWLVREDGHNGITFRGNERGYGKDTYQLADEMQTETMIEDSFLIATTLQKLWKSRYGDQWLEIDDKRIEILKSSALRGVHLSITAGHREDQEEVWKVDDVRQIAGIGGSTCFKPGHFWPLIFCAFRDGIINNVEEVVTTGDCGPTALPMLTGTETLDLYDQNLSVFVHEGLNWSIHAGLMGTNGRLIRVIRGHELQSPLAPSRGLRYDGLYQVKGWGMEQAANGRKYQVKMNLERCPGQKSMTKISLIPSPAQEDIWELCQDMIAAKKKAAQAGWSEQAGSLHTDFRHDQQISTGSEFTA